MVNVPSIALHIPNYDISLGVIPFEVAKCC